MCMRYGHFLLTSLCISCRLYVALHCKRLMSQSGADSVAVNSVAMFNNLRVLFKQAISGFCNVYICNWNVARNQLANVLCVCPMSENFCCLMVLVDLGLLFPSVLKFTRPWSGHFVGRYFCYILFLTVFGPRERHELMVYSNHFQELPIPPTWWSHFSLPSCRSPFVCLTVLLIPHCFVFCSAGVLFKKVCLARFRQLQNR